MLKFASFYESIADYLADKRIEPLTYEACKEAHEERRKRWLIIEEAQRKIDAELEQRHLI